MNATHWVLLANASQARLLERKSEVSLVPVHTFSHPASRERSSQLGDDKAGREQHGFGGAAFEPRVEAQRKEHLKFAHEIAEYLEQAARTHRMESVVLFAAEPFRSMVTAQLGAASRRLLTGSHEVDLSKVGTAELSQRIADILSRGH